MKKTLFILVGVIIVVTVGYLGITNYLGYSKVQQKKELPINLSDDTQDLGTLVVGDLNPEVSTTLSEYQFEAILKDVSKGSSSGEAMAGYIDGEYKMVASFENLPIPEGTDFYEGWIVRKSPLSVISTGEALKNQDGLYVNNFTSKENLSDHLLYVLTLEPDDGDPAPAVHILEGTFQEL